MEGNQISGENTENRTKNETNSIYVFIQFSFLLRRFLFFFSVPLDENDIYTCAQINRFFSPELYSFLLWCSVVCFRDAVRINIIHISFLPYLVRFFFTFDSHLANVEERTWIDFLRNEQIHIFHSNEEWWLRVFAFVMWHCFWAINNWFNSFFRFYYW